MSGTWFFSSAAGDRAVRFAGGAGFFSDDDGFWGSGDGIIDGDGGTITTNARWGFGNRNGSDTFASGTSGEVLKLDGVHQTSIPAGFQNQVLVNTLDVPQLNPVSASLPLMFAFISLAISGSRRKRA